MNRRIAGGAILALTIIAALVPLIRGSTEIPTSEHHLLHAVLIAGAVIAAILLAQPSRDASAGHYYWLLLAILSPIAAMMLMWPSEYAWFEQHPAGHAIEHLGLIGLGFISGYAGQRYAAGVGWATGLSLLFMAVAAAWGFGVAPPPSALLVRSVGPSTSALAAVSGSPDRARGAKLFAQNCEACHGAQGGGGAGPSLKGENLRKNLGAAQAWIMNPSPPMPKLFPQPLSRADVRDIAGYIETL
ncbi:MAG: cytochrome c [Candidatus Eremiobacteraeota bacterium]|nr:cytochrome c [Candidatus Eremiobacteraeota bacterium]